MVVSLTRVTARGVSISGLSKPKAAALARVSSKCTGSPDTVMDSTPCAHAPAQKTAQPAAAKRNEPRLMGAYIGIPNWKCHVTFYIIHPTKLSDTLSFSVIYLNYWVFCQFSANSCTEVTVAPLKANAF